MSVYRKCFTCNREVVPLDVHEREVQRARYAARGGDLEAEVKRLRSMVAGLDLACAYLRDENKTLRAALAQAKRQSRRPAALPHSVWRFLARVAHPDRHPDTPAAHEALVWLNDRRPT